jgi:RNA binding exosome subunit
LSSKTLIAYIDLRVFAHATEDLDKVLAATRNVLPTDSVDNVVFKKSNLTGHHGNPIILCETRIKERRAVQMLAEKLSQELSTLDKESLSNKISEHMDRGNLYVRLDKQSAYLNRFRLGSADPIHLKIHFKKHSIQEITDICRKIGLLP